MPKSNTDVLIYIPFKKANLSDIDNEWINSFQNILKVSLRQISKHEINLSTLFYGEKSDNQNIELVLLLNKDFEAGYIEEQYSSDKRIQINCHPELNSEISNNALLINLFDESTNKPIDLSKQIYELKNEIWLKFLDIAYEIRKYITKKEEVKSSKGKIFLAETSVDQNSNRETIIRELEHLGFDVLPKANFPKDMLPFSEMVHDNLKECFLSIHLIGNFYAPLLNNIDISSIELQNDLFYEVAAELQTENKIIKRLVWIPPDLKPKSEKQKLYIESFKRNIELLKNTEIIQTPIEVFKNIIREKAENLLEIKEQSKTNSSVKDEKWVYLISNDIESKTYKDIKQGLSKHKFKVLESKNTKSKVDQIQEHYYNLVNCDAILIDYSVDNTQWLNSKLSDIIKSPGFGRKKSFLAKNILINTPNHPKLNLEVRDLDINSDNKTDTEKRLKSFIEKIT